MAEKPTILIQLDTDPQASTFDRVVAVDSGVQHIFSYAGIKPGDVMPLVHGAIFTRSPAELKRTALFIGGSDVAAGEAILAEVRRHLIPDYGLSVSVMLDSNGANTTAAAAVRAASRHLDLSRSHSLVLGGTGPVGQRVARLLARHGGHVRIGSRQKERAEAVCAAIQAALPEANLEAVATASSSDAPAALEGRDLVIAAGAPGVVVLPKKHRQTCPTLRVMIDLNGVPPTGIEGVELADKATNRDEILAYGALGIGGTKMKVHKAAIAALFEKNNAVFNLDELYEIAQQLP
jgi:hypothetical protein